MDGLTYRCAECRKKLLVQPWADLKVCPYCDTGRLVREYTPEEVRLMRDEAMVDGYRDRMAEREQEQRELAG